MNQGESTINHNYIKQLYTILGDECELYNAIAKVEKEKNQLLMKGVFTDLEPINSKLSTLVEKSINLEQTRITITNFITKELNLPPSSSLKRVLLNLPDEYIEKFNKQYEILTEILLEIKRLNNINSRLINDTLRIIDVTLDAYINGNSSIEINYGKQIKGKKNSKKNIINNPKLFSKEV